MKNRPFALIFSLGLLTFSPVHAQAVDEAESLQSETEQLLEQAQTYLEPEAATATEQDQTTSGEDTVSGSPAELEPQTSAANQEETLLLLEGEAQSSSIPKDMLLVLDNSGSMKKNDPNFLTNQAVREFIGGLDEATRLGIIIFDQNVQLTVPFTEVSRDNSAALLASLDKINYKGLYTDSPAAIERAIYELKNNGREDAEKIIVFMTDGIVDTGDAAVDLEKTRWLKDDLAADAADNKITIFGIAFTENADFQLIQSLAQKTDGEYYRALQAEDLTRVFDKIVTIINTPPEPEPVPEPVVAEPAPVTEPEPVVQAPPPPPP
ncbi:MAG: vWA domain-containing protein, partial [Gammaproteobacteria bacterium]|nr:vWA domain-containing protein [Gammaproteobacteria bacterium]